MTDYFFENTQKWYDNALPERYDEEPLFECDCCGEGIFDGEEYYEAGDCRYCLCCVSKRVAEGD